MEGYYNIVMVSTIHQHESAMGIPMSPPSLTSLPPPFSSHPSRRSWNTGFGFPVSYNKFLLTIYFTDGNVCVGLRL